MRIQRINLLPNKDNYRIKSLQKLIINRKNQEIIFDTLEPQLVQITYSIENEYIFHIKLKKSVKKEIPVLYQINNDYTKLNLGWENNLFQSYKNITDDNKKYLEEVKNEYLNLNKDLKYHFYDDNDCINFFKKYYDDSFVEIFNNIKQGAIKCDFWRICVLYIFGGNYCDIDFKPLQPFKLINENKSFVGCVDMSYCAMFNAYIYSSPRNPILLNSILEFFKYNHKEIIWNIGAFDSNVDLLQSIKKEIYTSDCISNIPHILYQGDYNDGKVRIIEEKLCGSSVYDFYILYNGTKIFKSRRDNYNYKTHQFYDGKKLII